MTPRLLIVNADDFGLTSGISDGVLRGAESGVITSASILMLGPNAVADAPRLRDSGLGVGCHLALVGEDPLLLSPAEVPTLVGRSGRPTLTWRSFLGRVARGAVDPDDVRREFNAQLDAAAATGLTVDHLDTHQHLHLWPGIGQVVLDLAVRRGVGAVRCPSATSGLRGRGVQVLERRLRRRAHEVGVAVTDAFAGLDGAGHLGLDGMTRAIDRFGDQVQSAELAVHPGLADHRARERYRWDYDWEGELAALQSPDLRRAVLDAGFTLGTFADLPTGRRAA
ncbi:MAG: carbohydrate deacetylase [Actinomycetes bacterium]